MVIVKSKMTRLADDLNKIMYVDPPEEWRLYEKYF